MQISRTITVAPKTSAPKPAVSDATKEVSSEPKDGFLSTLGDGARALGGAASVLLHTPVTLTGPLYNNEDCTNYLGAATTGGCLVGAAIPLLAGGGLHAAAIGGFMGGAIGFGFGGFHDFTAIEIGDRAILNNVGDAQKEARANTEGNAFRKSVAVLSAGYKEALRVSFQRGQNVVDAILDPNRGAG